MPPQAHATFPFTAVVGANPDDPGGLDDMALALVLTTISPAVGGVLVRGEKGTAKSTLVRALAGVLPPIEVVEGDRFSCAPDESSPDAPFPADARVLSRPVRLVELPVGATEDRVLGSLHLERALADGATEYEPGLLAKAHRGILYVDEVNLLHDHLVDVLLDAAAMGRSTVERDSVSVEHPARFVLVGTMNPEEGELRPQLLDRFGLTVEVAAPRDPARRVEVVRRRLAFEADPAGFASAYAEDEAALAARIRAAQELLGKVELDDEALLTIAEVCAAFDVDGLRADIVTARAAAAHAAWAGRAQVTREDIRVAARLSLPHRRRRNPLDAPGIDEDQLDELLGDDEPEPPTDGPDDGPDDGPGGGSDGGAPPEGSDDEAPVPPQSQRDPQGSGSAQQSTVGAGSPYRARLLRVDGLGEGEAGRRSRAITRTGRMVGVAPEGSGIHLPETIRAAAPHQVARGRTSGRLRLVPGDLRRPLREGRESNLVLFCVDASGSMAARTRMEPVKTAILSLLLDAYRRRDKVGLITFRGDRELAHAEVALPPTHSVEIAARRLSELPAGGRTPLAEGLLRSAEVLRLERIRDPRRRPLLVVLTDGRATHGPDAVERSRAAARQLADRLGAGGAVVVDCETGRMRLGLARPLADSLQAEYLPLAQLDASALADVVRDRRVA